MYHSVLFEKDYLLSLFSWMGVMGRVRSRHVLLAAGWSVRLEVRHQLLLLREHLLQDVQLRLQLLYRQLATTRGRGRVLRGELIMNNRYSPFKCLKNEQIKNDGK